MRSLSGGTRTIRITLKRLKYNTAALGDFYKAADGYAELQKKVDVRN